MKSQIETNKSVRLLFIDNIKIALTILVILHHTAISYGAHGSWYYYEHSNSELLNECLSFFTGINGMYFMGFFFLIAGYFTPSSYSRKGAKLFIKDRLFRLGIPLLIYVFTINPFLEYIKCLTTESHKVTFWDFYNYNTLHFRNLPTGIMWFVEALLIFSLAYVILQLFKNSFFSLQPRDEHPLSFKTITVGIIILTAFTFVTRIWFPMGKEVHNFQLAFFPQYIMMFIAGTMAYRNNWFRNIPNKFGKIGISIVIVVMILGETLNGFTGIFENDLLVDGGLHWQSLITSLYQAIFCTGMCVSLLVLFRSKFNTPGKLTQILSKNTYTAYILHGLIIVTLGYSMMHLAIPSLVKFIIVSVLGTIFAFLASALLLFCISWFQKSYLTRNNINTDV